VYLRGKILYFKTMGLDLKMGLETMIRKKGDGTFHWPFVNFTQIERTRYIFTRSIYLEKDWDKIWVKVKIIPTPIQQRLVKDYLLKILTRS